MKKQSWYVKQGSRIQGPFSEKDIRKFILQGRIKLTDQVSEGGNYEDVSQVPELVPDEMLPSFEDALGFIAS